MSTKHTPGPWIFDEVWALIQAPDSSEIAAVHAARGTKGEPQANARLIAAAPDLLAALIECEALLARIYNANGLKPQEWVRTPKGERAAKAIAKATGQQ